MDGYSHNPPIESSPETPNAVVMFLHEQNPDDHCGSLRPQRRAAESRRPELSRPFAKFRRIDPERGGNTVRFSQLQSSRAQLLRWLRTLRNTPDNAFGEKYRSFRVGMG